jgi:hypothetical protein
MAANRTRRFYAAADDLRRRQAYPVIEAMPIPSSASEPGSGVSEPLLPLEKVPSYSRNVPMGVVNVSGPDNVAVAVEPSEKFRRTETPGKVSAPFPEPFTIFNSEFTYSCPAVKFVLLIPNYELPTPNIDGCPPVVLYSLPPPLFPARW